MIYVYGSKQWWYGEPEDIVERKRDPDKQYNELFKMTRKLTQEELDKYHWDDLTEDGEQWWNGDWGGDWE